MAIFRPFKGLLPVLEGVERIEDRVSPPYDVIAEGELGPLKARPHNITRITLGSERGGYDHAARLLNDWISSGKLREDDRESYYVLMQSYEHAGKNLVRTGIVGILGLETYDTGRILPHEETFPGVKEDRLNLLRATGTHLESIFCLYDHIEPELMDSIVSSALIVFELLDDNGTRHSFGRISDQHLIRRIESALSEKRLLIADGHHRYETALRYASENPQSPLKGYVLATLTAGNDPGLLVLPTHRIFSGATITTEEFIHQASNFFAIWEVRTLDEMMKLTSLNNRVSLGVIMADARMFVFELAWKPTEDALWSVDTYVCEELVLKKILQKKGEVTVDYDHDASSVAKKMSEGKGTVAVVLSPPKLDTIWRVACEGERMPKKSTFFYPKVWSGFVAYRMK